MLSIHNGIKCQNCQIYPIAGIRYKCIKCESYDLCEECEKKVGKNHGHALLKLRTANQIDMLNKKVQLRGGNRPNRVVYSKPTFKCENSSLNFKTKNNNTFINIPVTLSNNGNSKWSLPCYFTCLENFSQIKGKKVRIPNCTGEPGVKVNFNIKIDLSNVNKSGDYRSVWSLQNEQGEFFVPMVTFKVNDIFEGKLKLKPYYLIKKIEIKEEEFKPITTEQFLSKNH